MKELEGPRGGGACFAGHGRSCQPKKAIIAYWYRLSMVTWRMAERKADWSCKLLNRMELQLLSENLTSIHSTCILRFELGLEREN
jgi:hypothetical protein